MAAFTAGRTCRTTHSHLANSLNLTDSCSYESRNRILVGRLVRHGAGVRFCLAIYRQRLRIHGFGHDARLKPARRFPQIGLVARLLLFSLITSYWQLIGSASSILANQIRLAYSVFNKLRFCGYSAHDGGEIIDQPLLRPKTAVKVSPDTLFFGSTIAAEKPRAKWS